MKRILTGLAAGFLALILAPTAQAQPSTLFAEFQAICIANHQDMTASEKVARARQYEPLPPDPRVVVGLSKTEGENYFVYGLQKQDVPAVKPTALQLCVIGNTKVTAADHQALALWASVPILTGEGDLKYMFRVENGRKIPVSASDAGLIPALDLGPVYVVNVRVSATSASFTLGEVKLK